jgi:beta-lactamase superfamily II metal-dependent hydrolase
MRVLATVLLAALSAIVAPAPAPAAQTLDVYVIDVEGGKSVLIVSPSGESMLFDVGSPGREDRDVKRIVEAARAAGLTQIDYLVISHFDGDHMGDVPLLVSMFPVRRILDNGHLRTTGKNVERRYATYAAVRDKMDHMTVRPGDRIPIKGVDVLVLTAAGKLIEKPVQGGGEPNLVCAGSQQEPEIPQDLEDNMSIGLLFTLGKFRMLDLADLESHYDYKLMCPSNPVGTVDVYQVSIHGQDKGVSPVLAHALQARVAIMGNGPKKGGAPATWQTLRGAPGLEDIWQAHYSLAGGKEGNPPEEFIANVDPECQWKWIKLSAWPDGTFTVSNGRNNFSKTYRPQE